ncbi:MAG: hypothetical protein L0I76_35425 [Pseudonocardia sp.]|nr:hypothetical protein [Pseudonocardia sp.]
MFIQRNAHEKPEATVTDRAMTEAEKAEFRAAPWPAVGRAAWAVTGWRWVRVRVRFWHRGAPRAIEGTPLAVWTVYRAARKSRA